MNVKFAFISLSKHNCYLQREYIGAAISKKKKKEEEIEREKQLDYPRPNNKK